MISKDFERQIKELVRKKKAEVQVKPSFRVFINSVLSFIRSPSACGKLQRKEDKTLGIPGTCRVD